MSAHRGSVSVVDATYLGRAFSAAAIGLSESAITPPGAGEDLVGPPAEQERVGTLVDLGEERRGLVVVLEQRQGERCVLPRHGPVRLWNDDVMRDRPSSRATQSRALWPVAARLGYVHWILGNLYEAVVDMPQLLADAQPNREPRLLGAGSPVRYYLPATPLTLVATAATLIDSWRSGGDRRAIAAAAASTASAAALTAYLVRTVNLRLLQSGSALDQTESSRLVKAWHRGNLVRLSFLAVAALALRQAGQAVDPKMDR